MSCQISVLSIHISHANKWQKKSFTCSTVSIKFHCKGESPSSFLNKKKKNGKDDGQLTVHFDHENYKFYIQLSLVTLFFLRSVLVICNMFLLTPLKKLPFVTLIPLPVFWTLFIYLFYMF